MDVKFDRCDTADYLETEDNIAACLDAVMEDGDPAAGLRLSLESAHAALPAQTAER